MVNSKRMMILEVKTSTSRFQQAGFTLLEMMVTLSIMVTLFSVVFVSYKPDSKTERMKKASIALEALSARGHTMAVLHQKPFWLRFEKNRVVLEGARLVSVDVIGGSDESLAEELNRNNESSSTVEYDSFVFPEGMDVFVKRWGAASQAWFRQEKSEDPVIFWNFEEGGLCEPISMRMEIDESWTELEMDPLTARVADQTSEIYD